MDIVLEELLVYVEEIAGLISDTAPQVWEILMRQVYVDIAGYSLWFALSLATLIVGIVLLKKAIIARKREKVSWSYEREHGNPYGEGWELDEFDSAFAFGGFGLIALFGGIGVLDCLSQIIARLINPAWYAIQMVINGG